ncbi:mediator complex, subunit Med11 [Durotheca rogersii]|uniref:mediator complex, subunit Med11 n=1 Tax=Durotheca rogersii TaxID=419775 RepID=UPI00221EC752|nr:mediator complex, subunit Med11 [Durotheca rogersii]KAI5865252.1 mediator complex, subunit Med11 [Durotheca rogersii]
MERLNEEQPPFVPFTTPERIQQLGAIDQGIVSLLRSTASALRTLGRTGARDGDIVMADKDRQSEVFQDSMNEFLKTLRSVNVGMKRQIWGLEEASIISLGGKDSQATKDEGGEAQGANNRAAPIEPDGDGKIGGLDVGWLKSRSDKVEREMEANLWNEAESFFQRLLQAGGGAGTT